MIIKKRSAKIAIVPNVAKIAREMTTSSQVGIIVNRVLQLHLSSLFKMGLNNLPYLMKIAKKDFAAGIKVLTELEILKLRETTKTQHFGLHQQMTDMAVALRNRKMIEYLFVMAKTYGFVPYLYTCNVGPLVMLLSNSRTIPDNMVIVSSGEIEDGVADYMKNSHLKFMEMRNK